MDLKYERLSARRPGAEKRLLASLSETGQQSPVIVVAGGEAGRYVVVDGHKRVRALKRLKADVARVAVWEMDEATALATAYQLGQGRRDAFEEGWLVVELHRVGGWSLGDVGIVWVEARAGRAGDWGWWRLCRIGWPRRWRAGASARMRRRTIWCR